MPLNSHLDVAQLSSGTLPHSNQNPKHHRDERAKRDRVQRDREPCSREQTTREGRLDAEVAESADCEYAHAGNDDSCAEWPSEAGHGGRCGVRGDGEELDEGNSRARECETCTYVR